MRWLGLLALWLGLVSAPAAAEWRAYETDHFIIYSESPADRVNELATRLESYDRLMRMATNIGKSDPVKVRIFELPDMAAVQKAAWAANSGVAGFYSSNIMGPYLVTPRRADAGDRYFTPELVLQHEYAHHFMLQYFPAIYPSWYVEGFAELIGSSTYMKDGTIRYGEPARHRGNDIVADWVPLQELLTRERVTYFDTYGQGWALTHFLTFDKTRSAQLRHFLTLLKSGVALPEASRTAFGDLQALNQEARRYAGSGSFPVRPVKVDIEGPVVKSVRTLTSAEAALIPEAAAFTDYDLSAIRKVGDRERAQKNRQQLLETIRKKATGFPSDPYAFYLLAEAEYVVGNRAEATRAAERVSALDPNHVRAMFRRSVLLAESARALPSGERQQRAAEARQLALRANKLDPNDPLPLLAYYQSFNLAGERPTAQAVTALESAQATLPDNDAVRLLLVEQYARDNSLTKAMAMLMPLANSPHDSPQRTAARERMAQLRAQAGTAPAVNSTATPAAAAQ